MNFQEILNLGKGISSKKLVLGDAEPAENKLEPMRVEENSFRPLWD